MKKIKFILAAFVLSLGFLFCFCLSVSVDAEEVVETETTEQINVVGVYEYNEEGKGSAKFTLYSDYTFVAELHDLEKDETIEGNGTYILDGNVLILNTDNGILKCKVNGNKLEPYAESEEIEVVEPNSFLSHLKDLKWDEAEAIFTFIGSYLGIDFILKVIMSVIIIVFKLRKDEQLKISKEALVMAEVEHKQNEEELKKQHNAELKELTSVMQNLKNEVKEFMNGQTEKIVSLTTDTTKEIANDLAKISDSLKDTE